jgi:hypothetical protein
MLNLIHLFKRTTIAFALMVLSVVLFPGQMRPLWSWGNTTGEAVGMGKDPLPDFADVEGFAGMSLLAMAVTGIVYNLWRDRRYEVLRAEYNHQTGASHLRQKVQELEQQATKATQERQELEKAYANLNKQYTTTLVAAKEHEIHSKYGQEDRAALKELRARFEALLRERGSSMGVREAWEMMMNSFPQHSDLGDLTLHQNVPEKHSRGNGTQKPPALPFGK